MRDNESSSETQLEAVSLFYAAISRDDGEGSILGDDFDRWCEHVSVDEMLDEALASASDGQGLRRQEPADRPVAAGRHRCANTDTAPNPAPWREGPRHISAHPTAARCSQGLAAQLFPGVTDNAQARECVRTIAGWKPLRPVKRMPKVPRVRHVR